MFERPVFDIYHGNSGREGGIRQVLGLLQGSTNVKKPFSQKVCVTKSNSGSYMRLHQTRVVRPRIRAFTRPVVRLWPGLPGGWHILAEPGCFLIISAVTSATTVT
jgi:hypothetical protein